MTSSVLHSAHNQQFTVEWHYATGQVESLSVTDAQRFTWIRGLFGMPSGMCYLDKRQAVDNGVEHTYEYMNDLRLTVRRQLCEEGYLERYVWQNVGKKAVSVAADEVGVYVTFAEQYDIASVALPYRAFTHIFCAKDTFYMANARMNGQPDGIGLVLQQGEVHHVVEERLNPLQRGDLLVTMPACELQPEQQVVWQWLVFAYDNRAQFWQKVREYAPQIEVWPLYPRPQQTVTVALNGEVPPMVTVNGQATPNPFAAPEGEFWVQADAAERQPTWTMRGQAHEQRWCDLYRKLGRGKSNPRRDIALAIQYARAFSDGHDEENYRLAQQALLRFYRTSTRRRPEACLPALLIKSSEPLKSLFAAHVKRVLKAKHALYTAQWVEAMADMMAVANVVFDGQYEKEWRLAQERAIPLLNTPFGSAFDSFSAAQDEATATDTE